MLCSCCSGRSEVCVEREPPERTGCTARGNHHQCFSSFIPVNDFVFIVISLLCVWLFPHSCISLDFLLSMDVSLPLNVKYFQIFSWDEMRGVNIRSSLEPFLDPRGPVIVMKPCRINGKIFEWILISRRSCFRAGVRYYVRGMTNNNRKPEAWN